MAKNKAQGRGGILIAGLGFGVAIGTVLGSLVITPATPGLGHAGVDQEKFDEVQAQAEISQAQANSADSVVKELAGEAVTDTLSDQPILVIRTADASDGDVKGVKELLKKAGATDAGTLTLTEKFSSSDGADSLKSIVANTLTAGAQLNEKKLDPGTHAGDALGPALLLKADSDQPAASDKDRDQLLGALKNEGYLDYQKEALKPARAVVLISGDSDGSGDQNFAAGMLANFSRSLAVQTKGTVVAGRIHTASDSGLVGQLRANSLPEISTVDSLSRDWGRLATVLALSELFDGHNGHYGSAASANAAVPKLPSE